MGGRLRREGGKIYLLTLFRWAEGVDDTKGSAKMRDLSGISVLSGRGFVSHMMQIVYGDFVLIAGFALLIVGVLLWLGFLHLDLVFAALLPLLLAWLLTFGCLGWLGWGFLRSVLHS